MEKRGAVKECKKHGHYIDDICPGCLREAAPDLLAACKAQHEAIDILFAMLIEEKQDFFPSKSGQPWEAMLQGNQAITKAKIT